MKLSEDLYERIGLTPITGTFGIELEVENLNSQKIKEKLGQIDKTNSWKVKKDPSLKDHGSEVISPILSENRVQNVWETIDKVCEAIKASPKDETRDPYIAKTCGAHVHFDGRPFANNPDFFKNFKSLWSEAEELIYKMCNDKNDPIREDAINSPDFKNYIFNPLTYSLMFKDGMAHPSGENLIKKIENEELMVKRYPKAKVFTDKVKNNILSKTVKCFINKLKYNPERYNGLNTTGVGDLGRNTIEFRISNGTFEPKVIKENVFLYGSLIETAKKMTLEPETIQDKIDAFYDRDVSEKEKVNRFLNLIMDDDYSKKIFKERWESVKDAPVFSNYNSKSKFLKTFNKDDYEKISSMTNKKETNKAFREMQNDMKDNSIVR